MTADEKAEVAEAIEEFKDEYITDGQGKMVDYVITFVDKEGEVVGTQEGTAEKSKKVALEFPEGYSWISNAKENYQVTGGNGTYGGKSFTVKSNTTLEMTVRLHEKK